MDIFLTAEAWLALLTLTFFEVVLGIDNIIFISIVSNRLPREIRARTRNIGLLLAMVVRILLLLTITWVMKFQEPLMLVPTWVSEDGSISGRDLILIFGGMFLIAGKLMKELRHGDYRTVFNCGPGAQQSVFHLHLHVLAGRTFTWPPG